MLGLGKCSGKQLQFQPSASHCSVPSAPLLPYLSLVLSPTHPPPPPPTPSHSQSFNLSEGTYEFVLWLRLGGAAGGGESGRGWRSGRAGQEALQSAGAVRTPAAAAAAAGSSKDGSSSSSSTRGSRRRRISSSSVGGSSSSGSSSSRGSQRQHIVATAHFPDGSSLAVGSVTARQGCWNRLHGGLHLASDKEEGGGEGRERVGEGRAGSVEIRVRIADGGGGGGGGRGKGEEAEVWVTGASMSKISPSAWKTQQMARMQQVSDNGATVGR